MAVDSPAKKNHAWIWIFVFLLIASVGVAAFMIRYNLSLQLEPEQLEAARALWREKGPHDYVLVYTKQLNESTQSDKFTVKVRAGKVDEVLMNGMPLEPDLRGYHSMDRLFADIAKFLEMDRAPGARRNYNRAVFNETSGALRSYVRREMGTRRRVAIDVVKLEPLPPP